MILPLFFLAVVALAVAWCAGMMRLWNGRPRLALWSAAATMLVGFLTMAVAFAGDRYSTLLFGSLGQGDGMGMIGLILASATAVAVAFVAFAIAGVTYLFRHARHQSAASGQANQEEF